MSIPADNARPEASHEAGVPIPKAERSAGGYPELRSEFVDLELMEENGEFRILVGGELVFSTSDRRTAEAFFRQKESDLLVVLGQIKETTGKRDHTVDDFLLRKEIYWQSSSSHRRGGKLRNR